MSKIDDLIAEYCPDGVERKPLGAIAKLYRGNGLQKKDFTDKGIGCIHYGQIYTRYDTFTSQTISFVDKKLADKLLKVHPNDLIVTATSENLEDVCKAVAWLGGSDIVTGGHSIVVRHHQNAKYLSYYFQTLDFFQRKRAYVHGTKVMEITHAAVAILEDGVDEFVVEPSVPVGRAVVDMLETAVLGIEVHQAVIRPEQPPGSRRRSSHKFFRLSRSAPFFDPSCFQALSLKRRKCPASPQRSAHNRWLLANPSLWPLPFSRYRGRQKSLQRQDAAF